MSAQDKAANLFEYISKVYAIDLPVARIVTSYDDLFWRQADLIPCSHCRIKEFDRGNKSNETNETPEAVAEDAWLAVYKSSYDDPPPLPPVLKEWVGPSSHPARRPKSLPAREGEERFEDKPSRMTALNNYLENHWDPWAKQVLPLFKANELYDQLFSLHQRLSVEGDRIEILWGHLFLAWNYSAGIKIHHPLLLTPLDLEFNPDRRKITLRPAQSRTTQFDLECLRELDYPNKDKLLKHVAKINSGEAPPDVWNHDQMRGIATTVTGLLSTAPVEDTNLYENRPIAQPPASPIPAIYNAPVIFVRQRARHFWIDDAQKTAESVQAGNELSPFIRSLVADQSAGGAPNLEDGATLQSAGGAPNLEEGAELVEGTDDGELFFPLEYNDQQKEILDRLKERFGVLVQGPPGTGKSHTIANIISSLLARGKRVLVTSQTENALKVLRDLIPPEIRSLCVSQLGSDAESKKQLNDSVVEIGKRLALRNSREPEERIGHIGSELKTVREEQSRLHQQIRDWAELDSCKITIGGAEVTAHQAAKECSYGDKNHSWLPDRLAPETEPPLSDGELKELCALLGGISPQDRQACLQYLPDPARIQSTGNISKVFDDLRFASARAVETEDLRADWPPPLREAQPEEIIKALSILEPALTDWKRLDSEWRLRLLNLMVSGESQNSFWREFLQACTELYECAFPSFQEIQGFEITIADLPPDFDRDAALEELRVNVEKGKNPSSALTRLLLSQPAKQLFDAVRIDGKKLTTLQRIDLLWARFSYEDYLKKFELRWDQGIRNVNGPGRDPEALMPLADVESRLKDFRAVVEWIDNHLTQVGTALTSLGCPSHKQTFHKGACLGEHLETLQGQVAAIDEHRLTDYLRQLQKQLSGEAKKQYAHPLWAQFAAAIKDRSSEDYKKAYEETTRLAGLRPGVAQLEHLLKRLQSVAPKWASKVEREAAKSGVGALPQDWALAWRWRRLNEWLIRLHNRESVENLQNRLERARKVERELITQLVTERTWERQISNIEDRQYMALTAWANAMRQFGKGTGRYAQRHLAAANRAMVEAVGAVPVWIMPLFRVVQSFEAKPGAFDVVIVDEASQCDLRALPVLYRGKKVLIVGDPEQISPANVGIEKEKIYELNRQFLTSIPYPERFDIDHSLYEITGTIPEIDRILLTEHFRCVPPIIEFNNHLSPSYGGRLEPLRRPSPHEILDPPIQAVYVEDGYKNSNDINEPEAERLVESVVNLCQDPRYALSGGNKRKRTMGIISLLGEKQAKHISNLIARHPGLDEREREERRIICGDAYAFQGDERDVMFLSLVIATNAPFSPQVREDARRRFNVATSRARDQVFLFHSVRLRDINNPECVRHKLLSWYLNPPKSEVEAGLKVLKQTADSEFEFEVGESIIGRGYTVIPQFRPFPRDSQYRIDLVVEGENGRVAIECDGDRWPGDEKWEYDQHREAQLRRAGWKFWRISGSAFYRNKEKALAGLWEFMEDAGVNPNN
ncbi:MAG TPA: AAA domain-containing protein [Blastocatellia bacterium]|nr:AAA domain-containing protein [Blastocatellia bacterium]